MPETIIDTSHPYTRRVPLPFDLPTGIYGAMLVVWHLRPLLQRRFPLHNRLLRDHVRFLAWCATDGRKQFQILREIPEWDEDLGRPVELPRLKGDQWASGFSVAMFFFGVARHRYTFGGVLDDRELRSRVARAFWRGDRHKCFFPAPTPWQIQHLRESFDGLEDMVRAIRTPKESEIPCEQLVEQYGLSDISGIWESAHDQCLRPAPVGLPKKIRRSPVRLPLPLIRSIFPWAHRVNPRPGEAALTSVMRRVSVVRGRRAVVHPFGVNLYGYANGEIGIGEDVRLVAAALEANGVPFCLVNVQPGKNVSQADESARHWIVPEPLYGINVFCMTGVEQGRFVCERGLTLFRGRYSIGFWPWELSRWPTSCRHAFGAVDELWGISSHTAKAYSSTCHHPVHTMSLPVTIDMIGQETRRDFGLPEDEFLFFFAFDINSKATRKNPDGLIHAFLKAFPKWGREKVGLVIKVSHPDTPCSRWKAIRRLAARDQRIHIIEETMRRPKVLALMNCCECFVSLHRAEGFGRCLAEALLLEKQVIATGFSGNMDFCSEPRVAFVRHRMREIQPGEYFWSQGQLWAEPDLDHAASLMREIRLLPRQAGPLPDFSPAMVGQRYAARLAQIKVELGI